MNIKRNYPGLIIGVAFGLFFTIGGFNILSETAVPTWQDWYEMQAWSPAAAELLEVSGSDNETRASYRYTVKGVTYDGDRVYVSLMKDNIGSYHSDMYRQLRKQLDAGKTVEIWLNPNDPKQSVIDRDMRWGFFALMSGFCSIFILIGLLIIYASIIPGEKASRIKRPSLAALRKEWEQKLKDPDFTPSFIEYRQFRLSELKQEANKKANKKANIKERDLDWRLRKGWESSTIRSTVKYALFKWWLFAGTFSSVSLFIMFKVIKEGLIEKDYMALLLLLFPIAALFLLYKAVLATLEYLRFGTVLFEMDPYPGGVGGHIGGRVHVTKLPHGVISDSSSHLSVRMECVHSYVSGSGKDRKRRESIRWAEEGWPFVEHAVRGVDLVCRFDVPDGLPEADVDQSGDYYFWRLSVKADVQGINLYRQYNIPVFNTGEESRFVRHDVSAQVAERKRKKSEAAKVSIAQGDFDLPGLSRSMSLERQGGEITMRFPMFRNKIIIVFAGMFSAVFGFMSYTAIESVNADVFGALMMLFILPFMLIALLALIAMIFFMLDNLRVDVTPDAVTVLRRLLFIPTVNRQILASEISHLSVQRSGRTGQGVKGVEHFRLRLHDKQGKALTIVEDLDGRDVATHFCDYLAQYIDVEVR